MSEDLKNYTVRILYNASNVMEELLQETSVKDPAEFKLFYEDYHEKLKLALNEVEEARLYLERYVP